MTQFDFIRDYDQDHWLMVLVTNEPHTDAFTPENTVSSVLLDLFEIFKIVRSLKEPLLGKPRKLESLYRQFDHLVYGKLRELIGALEVSDFEKIFKSTSAKQRQLMFKYLIDFANDHADVSFSLAVYKLDLRDMKWLSFLSEHTSLSDEQARNVSFADFTNNPEFDAAWGVWQFTKPK